MTTHHWLVKLQVLAIRYCGRGIEPDISALTLAEVWGLYRHLSSMARGDSDAC